MITAAMAMSDTNRMMVIRMYPRSERRRRLGMGRLDVTFFSGGGSYFSIIVIPRSEATRNLGFDGRAKNLDPSLLLGMTKADTCRHSKT
jgi:hypothetical protein